MVQKVALGPGFGQPEAGNLSVKPAVNGYLWLISEG